MFQIKLKHTLPILAVFLSPFAWASDAADRAAKIYGYGNSNIQYQHCYKTIPLNNKDNDEICIQFEEAQRYKNYVAAAIPRINAKKASMNAQYNINKGRIKTLPNGRHLAKEADREWVDQEVLCSEIDFIFSGASSCSACDARDVSNIRLRQVDKFHTKFVNYQNTIKGGYGDGSAYNNPIACTVLANKDYGAKKKGWQLGGTYNQGDAARINAIRNSGGKISAKENTPSASNGMSNFNATGAAVGIVGGVAASFLSGSGGGGGMPSGVSLLPTEGFACLEYATMLNSNNNGLTTGGGHLKYSVNTMKCAPSMTYYYNQLVSWYCTYAGCYYLTPATIWMRKIWLYTNPYIAYGNTMARSDEIATTRITTSTIGAYPQIYVYPN